MKAVELFAGAGGLGMGVSKAGFKPVDIFEWDKWCCDTINENRKRRISAVRHLPQPTTARRVLEAVCAALPPGWQGTRLAGRIILYREKKDDYPSAEIIARS